MYIIMNRMEFVDMFSVSCSDNVFVANRVSGPYYVLYEL